MTFPIFIKAGPTRVSISREIKEVNRLRLQYERSLRSSMYSIFKNVGKEAAVEYEKTGEVDKAFLGLNQKIGKTLRASYSEVIERFGNRVFENRKMERFGQLLFQLYAREGAAKVVGITAATRNGIMKAIEIGEADGMGPRATAKLITERTGGSIARSRAATIARTETHAAASFATDEATRELGLPLQKKRWVSVSDNRTRIGHSAANGQEVGIDEKFLVPFNGSIVEMNYPHDGSGGAGNNINCRCLALYFTDEDSLFNDGTVEVIKPVPSPVMKPIIDIDDFLMLSRKSKFTKKDFSNKLNGDLSTLMAIVASKFKLPNTIKDGDGFYRKQSQLISTDIDEGNMTFAHEYGHHIDHMAGKKVGMGYWSINALENALDEDGKALGLSKGKRGKDKVLKEKKEELFVTKTVSHEFSDGTDMSYTKTELRFKGAAELSDIVDSFVGGKFRKEYNAWGHRPAYWKRFGAQQKEVFANMYAVHSQPKAVAWMKANIPITYRVFLKHMKELGEDV